MRQLIAGFKMSIDGQIEGPEGYADWVAAWSEEYGLTPQIDACLLGAGMYPGYEKYWTAIQAAGDQPLPMTGRFPTADEVKWGQFAAQTPHYVLSTSLTRAQWPRTRFLRSLDEVVALKRQPGKDIYLMGGARVAAALLDAGLIDELRLIVYPIVAGPGKPLFATIASRHELQFKESQHLQDGRVRLAYGSR
ncbi:MAG TPA: dihydrofolate reductase family protein [Steroidobacteraceae bacterium]|nr:dihydrofolate reductase family protein [Steroidobacteraceae bacterium]